MFIRLFAVLSISVLVISPLQAAPKDTARNSVKVSEDQDYQLAARLAELAGHTDIISAWKNIFSSLDNSACSCATGKVDAARFKKAWNAAVNSVLDTESASDRLVEALGRAFSSAELEALIEIEKVPFMRRVRSAEKPSQNSSKSVDRQANELLAAFTSLNNNPPRKNAIEDILKRSGSFDAAVGMALESSLGIAIGMASKLPDNAPKPDLDEIEARLETNRHPVEQQMRGAMLASAAFAYQALSLDDLINYRNVLDQTLVERSSKVVVEFLKLEMRVQAIAIGKAFAKELRKIEM